jgi:hypothetical protein
MASSKLGDAWIAIEIAAAILALSEVRVAIEGAGQILTNLYRIGHCVKNKSKA